MNRDKIIPLIDRNKYNFKVKKGLNTKIIPKKINN